MAKLARGLYGHGSGPCGLVPTGDICTYSAIPEFKSSSPHFFYFPVKPSTITLLVYTSPRKIPKVFYIKEIIKLCKWGVVSIISSSNKLDIVRVENDFLTHKQIEQKNGMLFMRIKKRSICFVK